MKTLTKATLILPVVMMLAACGGGLGSEPGEMGDYQDPSAQVDNTPGEICEGDHDFGPVHSMNEAQYLSNCEVIEGDLTFSDAYWATLVEFRKLKVIEGNFRMSGGVSDELSSLSGLRNLERVGGDFKISGDHRITSLGLTSLETVEGDFQLSSLYAIEDLDDLKNLEYVGGYFSLARIPGLSDLSAFDNIDIELSVHLVLDNISYEEEREFESRFE